MKDAENRHIVYEIIDEYFHHWLNEVDGLTEIAVNRPDELFVKVSGKWQQHELKMDFKDCMSFAGAISDYHDGGSVTPVSLTFCYAPRRGACTNSYSPGNGTGNGVYYNP